MTEFWSAEKFAKGEIEDLPFSYDYILGYRSTTRDIFFPKEYKWVKNVSEEELHGSVLRTRYLFPTSRYGHKYEGLSREDYEHLDESKVSGSYERWKKHYKENLIKNHGLGEEQAERVWDEFIAAGKETRKKVFDENFDTREAGKFWGPLSVARDYDKGKEGVKLKVLLPSEKTTIVARGNPKNKRMPDNEAIRHHYSEEEFREVCRKGFKGSPDLEFQYITPEIHLKNIQAVDDFYLSRNADLERWADLDTYVSALEREFVFEMQDFKFELKCAEQIREEVEFLRGLQDLMRKIEYYINCLIEPKTQSNRLRGKLGDLINSRNQKMEEVKKRKKKRKTIGSEMDSKPWYEYPNYKVPVLRDLERFAEDFIEVYQGGNEVKGKGYKATALELYEFVYNEFDHVQGSPSVAYKSNNKPKGLMQLEKSLEESKDFVQTEIERIDEIVDEENSRLSADFGEDDLEKSKRRLSQFALKVSTDLKKLPNLDPMNEKLTTGLNFIRSRYEGKKLKGPNPRELNKFAGKDFFKTAEP